MPELPEVETVRRQLDAKIHGRKITGVRILRSGREAPLGNRFTRALRGSRIKHVARRAKLLVFELTDGRAMISHLKMTGRFVFVSPTFTPDKHDRIIFQFQGLRDWLVWGDIRQFGFVRVVSAAALQKILAAYGPEPLETPAAVLADRLRTPKGRSLKAALLNQQVIAGVGNIYADEACHRAHLRPTRRLGTLAASDRLCVVQAVQHVLTESLAQQGTSANDYVDTQGERGGFLELLRVYGREGRPCKNCRQPVKKIVLAQRGTHYCPACQR